MADKPNVQPGFIGDLQDELKKVTWPTRRNVIRLTIVVILISLAVAAYVGVIDVVLTKALEALTNRR